jgi:hypothetical protein
MRPALTPLGLRHGLVSETGPESATIALFIKKEKRNEQG